jgi:hypothetical protein
LLSNESFIISSTAYTSHIRAEENNSTAPPSKTKTVPAFYTIPPGPNYTKLCPQTFCKEKTPN